MSILLRRARGSLAVVALFSSLLFAAPSLALAEEASTSGNAYSIPPGPLRAVLEAFVAQADLRLAADAGLTAGKHSAGLKGEFTVTEALHDILAGTGLDYRLGGMNSDDGNVLTLVRAAETGEDPAKLDSVTVTGEKFERTLLETLSSVVVVTAADLAEHGDRSLTDVMLRTPGVYAQSGNENWGIRGVPASGFDDQGPVTVNGAVAVYIDGVVQPHRAVTVNPLPLWDVASIEIFRGAQSTLQGRNALAGAIFINTNDPAYEPEFAARVNAGNHDQQGLSLLAGGGLVDGIMAGRFTVDYQETGGYIDNVTLGTDAFARRDITARGKLLVQPSGRLDMLFLLAHNDREMGENAVAAVNGEPLYYEIFYNTPGSTETVQDTVSAKIDYFLGSAWTLTSETSGTSSEYDSILDFDQAPTDTWVVYRAHANDLWSEELRLNYETATLRAYTGLYVSELSIDADDRLDIEGTNALHVLTDTRISNHAVFGEMNWDFAPSWQLIAGLRYDREDNDTNILYPVDAFGLGSTPSAALSDSFDAVLPKLGTNYRLADDHRLGFVVQRGYRAGGVHLRPAAAHETYEPEFTTNYEFSYRGAWPASGARIIANLYHTDWKDQQVRILDDNGFLRIVNAARSELTGLEVAAEYELDEN
ncbi:MAG TPA: TonB-dependent receptor, partial [Gammaproteobacteria bacterium]